MRTLVTALLLAAAAVPASAEEWFYVADGGVDIVLADADSIRPAGDALAVLGFFSSYDPIDDAGTIWYLISHFEIRCSGASYRVRQTDSYDAEHRLASSATESEDWAAIPADSYVESLRAFACDNVRAGAVGNPFDAADAYFEEDW